MVNSGKTLDVLKYTDFLLIVKQLKTLNKNICCVYMIVIFVYFSGDKQEKTETGEDEDQTSSIIQSKWGFIN